MIAVAMTLALLGAPCIHAHTATAGQPSPCDGVTVPVIDADRAGRCVAIDWPMCQGKLALCRTMASIAHTEAAAELAVALERADRLGELLDRAGAPVPRPWYEAPWFVATATAVAVATTTSLVWLVARR